MSAREEFEYAEKRTFMGRWGFALGICVLAGGGVYLLAQVFSSAGGPAMRKPPELVAIKPITAPTPPPPPPQQPPPTAPRPQEMTTLNPDDLKDPDPTPQDASPAIGTNIAGPGGPDGFGLGRNAGGSALGGSSKGGGGGTKIGAYGSKVKEAVMEALKSDPALRDAVFENIEPVVWLDRRGRVRRVDLPQSTGNPSYDNAIRSRLVGMQMSEPPPDNQSVRFYLKVSSRRPF